MGAQIAAHLANAGLKVTIFDLTADLARAGIDRIRTSRPDPFFDPGVISRLVPAGLDQLDLARDAGWVLEAVSEDAGVKRGLFARLEDIVGPDAIISTNTSALSIGSLAADRSAAFRRRFCGTHFFNPPRYLHLVEVVPAPETDAAALAALARFLDLGLGKGVVTAHDTPGFIANRIGVFGVVRVLEEVASGAVTIEEADALTGPLIGRPRSATFRTADIVGVDVLGTVARDLSARLGSGEPGAFDLPPFVPAMIAAGLIGVKGGQGFYRRETRDRTSPILVLDPASLSFRPVRPLDLPGLEQAGRDPDASARVRTLFLAQDRAGAFLRRTLGRLLVYAAQIAPDISESIDDIDRAMRWGFGWELGPFETWDAIGVRAVVDACEVAAPPPIVQRALAEGRDRLRAGPLPAAGPGLLVLTEAKRSAAPIRRTPGASLIDLGGDVACVEFHSKMNVIGEDTVALIVEAVAIAEASFAGLVIGGEGQLFSAGANLHALLRAAQEQRWDRIDTLVRSFQQMTMAVKLAKVPVVAAPAGLTIGGGCEICLHAAHIHAAAETYMGLVETGVGLIPAGGGTKEMLLRTLARAPASGGAAAALQGTFETIGFARVSTSAPDARRLGYLRETDGIVMNRERLIGEAADRVRALRVGYRPREAQAAIVAGGTPLYDALARAIDGARSAGRITDHDVLVGRKLAWVLSGGDVAPGARISEHDLLDREREAFLTLCGEPETLERIGDRLKKGASPD